MDAYSLLGVDRHERLDHLHDALVAQLRDVGQRREELLEDHHLPVRVAHKYLPECAEGLGAGQPGGVAHHHEAVRRDALALLRGDHGVRVPLGKERKGHEHRLQLALKQHFPHEVLHVSRRGHDAPIQALAEAQGRPPHHALADRHLQHLLWLGPVGLLLERAYGVVRCAFIGVALRFGRLGLPPPHRHPCSVRAPSRREVKQALYRFLKRRRHLARIALPAGHCALIQ
mmetsp:Transcript_40443/g.102353  ORF Transcript_40443/g.102353 Transcript_40443/m.102353 type:complete len:229 (-) Transcript_40443:352-1038(-)